MTAHLATERDVERIFTFDSDDFCQLGLTVVPDDVRVPDRN